MAYDFDWVDAFTTRVFAGNACMVVHGAEAVSEDRRTALVRETSLSECAFLVPSARADFGVRYYLADREVPMAGHPTIATVVSLLDRGLVTLAHGRTSFTLEVGAGVMEIEVGNGPRGRFVTMTQAAPTFGKTFDPGLIASLYGLDESDILGVPQMVSTGTPFCITVLKTGYALRHARLDVDKMGALRAREGAATMEPFLVVRNGETEAGDTFARLLLTPPSPPEDPFTGAATGCMAAYLWRYGLIDGPRFTAEQGHWLGRPGQAQVEVLGPRDTITGVKVGGQGRVLMRGRLDL